MTLVQGDAGFHVTQFQLKLRKVFPRAQITGVIDEPTLKLVDGLCQLRGVKFGGVITGQILDLLDAPAGDGQLVCLLHKRSPDKAAALVKALKTAGAAVKLTPDTSSPRIFLDTFDGAGPGDAVCCTFKDWPLSPAELDKLNQVKLVLVNTPFEAYCLHSVLRTPVKVLHVVPDVARYLGPNVDRVVLGYAGPRPNELAKLFLQAVNHSRYGELASLVCSEPVNVADSRVAHVPVTTTATWLAPLTCLIAPTEPDLMWQAAALGKPVLAPKISLPDHGFSLETALLVDNAFYAGKPVLGLPFSQDALVLELAKLVHSLDHVVQLGVATAQAARLAQQRLSGDVAELVRYLADKP